MSLSTPPSFQPGANQKLRLRNSRLPSLQRLNIRGTMASPPTVSWSTTNTITGRSWPAVANAGGVYNAQGSYFTFTRAGGLITGTTYPSYYFLKGTSVNYGAGSLSFNSLSVSFIHTGTAFSIFMGGYSETILIKVDDQYVSMTPQTFPNDGNLYYGAVTFASAGRRRIELIITSGSNTVFGGVYTAASDTIQPAAVRGPRAMFVGDSFPEGSMATSGAASNFPIVFGELMGWDDVWCSGVGSTGYLNSSGNRGTFRSRLATDVIPYNPDIVFFTGSVNDSSFTPAQIAAEALLCFQQIQQNLPNALICCVSPFLKTGAAYSSGFLLNARPLLQANVQSVGGIFIDLQQMPMPPHITPQATTLTSSCAANATTLATALPLRPFSHYQFADGSEVLCTGASGSSSPYAATVDKCANAQASGAALTQVGAPLWIGSGHVGATAGNGNCDVIVGTDGTHPTQIGHEAIAEAIAYGFMNQLYSN